jgi:hypothetical protein
MPKRVTVSAVVEESSTPLREIELIPFEVNREKK